MTVRIGVLGVGHWGRKLVHEYQLVEGAELVAVVDTDPGVRDRLVSKGLMVLDTPDALFASGTVDAVSVALPNAAHHPVTKAALAAGLHVLVEKPLALDVDQAADLLAAAMTADRLLLVGHIYRFNNAVTRVRALIGEGFFGEVFGIHLRWTNREPEFGDREVLMDLAPHAFDISNYLLDEWPAGITCSTSGHRGASAEEAAFQADHASGVRTTGFLSWLVPWKERSLTVVGSERSVRVDLLAQTIRVHEGGYEYDLDVVRNNTILAELRAFIATITGEVAFPPNSASIGLGVVRTIIAAQESARTGSRILLDLNDR